MGTKTKVDRNRPRRSGSGVQSIKRKGRQPKDKEADRKIGERIRFSRLTILKIDRQQDLADRLGVSRGAVGNWEQGKGIKRENLQRISRTFHISLEWLATGLGQPRASPSLETKMQLLPPDEYDAFYEEIETLLNMRLKRLGKGGNDLKE